MSDEHQFPHRIRVQRIEDYHTHFCGSRKENGNLILGVMTGALVRTNWPLDGRHAELNVVFEFSPQGRFLRLLKTESAVDPNTSFASLTKMVESLGSIDFHDIEVEVFETCVDGIEFGLIPDPESGLIHLQPGTLISFYPPWDGDYYT